MKYRVPLIAVFTGLLLIHCSVQAKTDQLIIILYHHIDTTTPDITSTSPDMFEQHLAYLKNNNFTVLPLKTALDAIYAGQPLPPKAIAITFDDGYDSIYRNGFPLLKKYNFPFTVFISTESIEKQWGSMMSWEQIRSMQQWGATIANHSHSHPHLLGITPDQQSAELEHSQMLIEKNLGSELPLFAYPYGEFDEKLMAKLKLKNWYGLSQVSGVVNRFSSPQALPRFAFAGVYASLEEFQLKINSLGMPILSTIPSDPLFSNDVRTLKLQFDHLPFAVNRLQCFYQGQAGPLLSWNNLTLTIELVQTFSEGRSRINCTAPAQKPQQFYWYSIPIFVEPKNKRWPE